MTVRALVVDDEAPARSELRYLLQAHSDVKVVGEAASAAEAIELARELVYDVVFLDVEMPGGATGLESAPHIHDQREPPAIVFVTAHYGEGVRLRSFPFGTVVRLEVPVA